MGSAILLLSLALVDAKAASVSLVDIELPHGQGALRGVNTASFSRFLGIPYAEAPTGSRRWRPPVPKAAWPGAVRNATAFGASCVQPGGFDPPIPNQHEDCLFLNVYGPPLAPPSYSVARLAPVLLYLHGGSYLQGSAAEQRLNATAAVGLLHARGEPMLIVTANYRLGVMGFLGGAELRAWAGAVGDGSSGNTGLQDQRLAMRWVRANIAAFGGDPARVTIAGQSAGAGAVSCHLVSPRSAGLFRRAAMMSGAFGDWVAQSQAEAQATFDAVLAAVPRCAKASAGAASAACLAANASAAELVAASAAYGWGPTLDPVELPHAPWNVGRVVGSGGSGGSGGASGLIPFPPGVDGVMVGETAEDGDCGIARAATAATLRAFVAQTLAPLGANESLVRRVADLYVADTAADPGPGQGYSPFYWAAKHMLADAEMLCPALRAARWASAGAARAYVYQFRYPAPDLPPGSGASHASDIPFVFHNVYGQPDPKYALHGPAELALSDQLLRAWRRFAATGSASANGTDGGLVWPAWSDTEAEVMLLDAKPPQSAAPHAVARFRSELCQLWDALPHALTPEA